MYEELTVSPQKDRIGRPDVQLPQHRQMIRSSAPRQP